MQRQKLSLSGPPDLLAVLPYHLGFHPTRSVVVVCLHETRLGLVARLDAVRDLPSASAVAASMVEVLRREAPTGVMLIGYEDDGGESAPLSEALAAGLALARLPLVDRIVVRKDRWTGLMCDCCRDKPVPAPYEVGAVATYVGLGRAALGSRDELAAAVQPDSPVPATLAGAVDDWVSAVLGEDTDGRSILAPLGPAEPEAGEWTTWAQACAATWGELLSGRFDGRGIPEAQLRVLLGSLRHRGFRDGIIATICPGSLGRDALDPQLFELIDTYVAPAVGGPRRRGDVDAVAGLAGLAVLREGHSRSGSTDPEARRSAIHSRLERLCRLAPDAHAAPVLAVTGTLAWFTGDGASARVAIERALQVEPDHVLTRLLAHLLDLGVRPPGLAA